MAYYTQGQGLISQRRGNASYFYHYDGLGSTKALTDANQNIQASYVYDAWGNILQFSGTITNPYLYVGELGYYSDGDSGMYLLTQRWYNSVIGRFMVRDPLREILTHLYIYGMQNPLRFTDPSGLGIFDKIKDWIKNACCKIKEFFKGEMGTLTDAIIDIFAIAMGGKAGAAAELLFQIMSCADIPDALKTCKTMIEDVARRPLKGDMEDQVQSCTFCCTALASALGFVTHEYLAWNACYRACSIAADQAKEEAAKPRPPAPKPPTPKPPSGKK